MRHQALPLLLILPLAVGCSRGNDGPPPSTPPGYAPPGQWVPPPPPTATSPPPFNGPWWQPPPSGGQFPFPPLFIDAGQRCVDTVNQYRQSLRLPPLARWFIAENCTAAEARDSAVSGQPHGAFGRCGELAQNVCPAWSGTPEQMTGPCIQSMWNEGPGGDFATHGHYLNMTSTRFTRVACGYFTAPQGSTWAVLNFQ